MKACNQCGKCCTKYANNGLSAATAEIEWWEAARPEIAKYVYRGEIWRDPDNHAALKVCPWLNRDMDSGAYLCDIYLDRPEDCKHYPVTIEQMLLDECEMLEISDLRDTKSAQRKLDHLMSDSRPAVD